MGGSVRDADLAGVGIHHAAAQMETLLLGALGDGRHGLERLHGVGTGSGLTGQHNGRGTVVDGVCHVRDLGAGGAGVHYHAVQHLGSGDDGLAKGEGAVDNSLLDAGQLGEVDLHAQIATGHHHGVGSSQNAVDVVHALAVLDLCNDADVGIVLVQQVADIVHVLCGAHKGGGDEIIALLDAEDDVILIALAHIRHGQVHAGHIDALLVLDLAAIQYGADDVGVVHGLDLQLDQAVVQHDGTVRLHVHGQILVGDGADLVGALHIAGGQGKGLAGNQILNAVLKVLQADLGTLGVQQCGHGLTQLLAQSLQLFKAAQMLLVGTVGKIEAGHVHAVGDQIAQHAFLIGGRAKGANNFRLSHAIYLRQLSLTYIRHSIPAGCCV